MKLSLCLPFLLALGLIATSPLLGQQSIYAQQKGAPRALFAADYQKKIAAVINADGSVRWSLPIRDIHDAQPLPGGDWLLQTHFGEVRRIDSAGKVKWVYTPRPEPGVQRVEIHGFEYLPKSKEWMIAESGNTRILLLDESRSLKSKIPLQVSKPDPHRDTRLVRHTPQDTFLVCHEADMLIREYNREGKIVWEYPVGKKAYSAVRLANGNTLIGTGDGHSVIEVSPDKEIVWQIGENDLPGVKLAWITMVQRLPSGNTWIVNCHAGPENPQIVEVSPDKKVVWSFLDFERFGNSLPVALPVTE
jgi:hypothetical protein